MKTIQIEKIKIKENIRKDYGDLTGLVASIKMHGVRNPVELNSDNELIDGYRRVKAAKLAGVKEVRYFVNEDEVDKTTSQLISGIFQKNLNPVEEGKAFQKYIDETKINVKDLAKKISKKTMYVEKRLELAKLSPSIQKALIKGKILMGHALLLARLPDTDSKNYLRIIIEEDYSVQEARDEIEYSNFSMNLSNAKFPKNKGPDGNGKGESGCKGCPYNGNVQAELFETGTVLSGNCMNAGCFKKKLKAFIDEKKKEFADVLYSPESDYSSPNGYVDGSHDWDCKDKGVDADYKKKCRKDRENYLVKIRENGEIVEYFKIPSKKKTENGEVVASSDEEVLEEKREQVLATKVNDFKTNFLINKSLELMKPSKQTKALAVVKLIQSANWSELDVVSEELRKIIKKGYGSDANVKNIFAASEEDLDKAIMILSRAALRRVDLKDLIEISRNFEVDIKKHFEITEEYLKLYTKDQLKDLMSEFKLNLPDVELKKDDLIQHILKQDLKGRTPKILL